MRGLEGNMQAEPRVFAHDAQQAYTDGRTIWLDFDTLQGGSGYSTGTNIATSGTGVPAALTVDITSVDSDGKITGLAINVPGTAGTDNSIADIAGGNSDASIRIRTTFPGSDERGACLYVGNSGDVNVIMESGTTILFIGVPSGTFLPILVKQVLAADTTASNILALY
jgi:hypothetical protein